MCLTADQKYVCQMMDKMTRIRPWKIVMIIAKRQAVLIVATFVTNQLRLWHITDMLYKSRIVVEFQNHKLLGICAHNLVLTSLTLDFIQNPYFQTKSR